jgi:hypothetical protein
MKIHHKVTVVTGRSKSVRQMSAFLRSYGWSCSETGCRRKAKVRVPGQTRASFRLSVTTLEMSRWRREFQAKSRPCYSTKDPTAKRDYGLPLWYLRSLQEGIGSAGLFNTDVSSSARGLQATSIDGLLIQGKFEIARCTSHQMPHCAAGSRSSDAEGDLERKTQGVIDWHHQQRRAFDLEGSEADVKASLYAELVFSPQCRELQPTELSKRVSTIWEVRDHYQFFN